jgi:hypothetical protein
MKKKSKPNQVASWLIMVQQHPKTNELYIELPQALIETLSLTDDDAVIWTPQSNGTSLVIKVERKK